MTVLDNDGSEIITSGATDRSPWTTPSVAKIAASEARDGFDPITADGGLTYS